jgi:hypothetical protein
LQTLCKQVHKAKLRSPPRRRRRDSPFLRPIWDFLTGGGSDNGSGGMSGTGLVADILPGR